MQFKTPPQNIEAEESVLCICLTLQESAQETIEYLRPGDFYKPAHSTIFESVCDLFARQQPIDLTTVTTALRDSGKLEKIGGATFISSILMAPFPTSLKHYAGMIKDAAVRREAIGLCSATIEKGFGCELRTAELVSELQTKVLSLGAESVDNFTAMRDLSMESLVRYEDLRRRQSVGIKTGFTLLDRLTGGLKGSSLIVMAARPGMGKTALMCNLVENMSKAGVSVGVFELEMDKEALDDRWNASLADINTIRLTSPQKLEHDEWERLNEVANYKSQWPVWIDDTGGMSVGEICRRARKMKRLGCQVIFIDQLSFIRGDKRKSTFEANTEHVEALGQLKKELRLPVVLLAQLNRDLEKREDKKPRLSDLKNTGMLEEAADMVLLGYRKHPYTKNEEDEMHAEWDLAKNRGGPTANMEMVWIGKQAKFGNKDFQYGGAN